MNLIHESWAVAKDSCLFSIRPNLSQVLCVGMHKRTSQAKPKSSK